MEENNNERHEPLYEDVMEENPLDAARQPGITGNSLKRKWDEWTESLSRNQIRTIAQVLAAISAALFFFNLIRYIKLFD